MLRRETDGQEMMDMLLGEKEEEEVLQRFQLDSGRSEEMIFNQAIEKVERISSRFKEVRVKTQDLRVKLDGFGVPVIECAVTDEEYYFSPWAFTQMADKIGMGAAQYLKKCLKQKENDLVPLNMNRWIGKNGDKDLLLRIYDNNQVKGVLSSRYAIFNHDDVLNSMKDVLYDGQNRGYQLESFSATPDNMQLRLVDPEQVIIQRERPGGTDRSTAGMIVKNGQTGMSSISIEFMVFTFACTNGLIVADDHGVAYRRKHYAVGRERFIEEVIQTFGRFPDYVEAAREDIERARSTRLDIEKRVELFDLIKKELRCGNEMVDKIKNIMDSRWDRTAWGLPGAITEVAQELSSERQYQFENFAGNLMQRLTV